MSCNEPVRLAAASCHAGCYVLAVLHIRANYRLHEELSMNASLAFVNGAGDRRRATASKCDPEGLLLLNALMSGSAEMPRPAVDKGKSKNERQAEEEGNADTASKPGGFDNDPDDPRNPNEVRERHLKKIKR
jgi:hypothetical protein